MHRRCTTFTPDAPYTPTVQRCKGVLDAKKIQIGCASVSICIFDTNNAIVHRRCKKEAKRRLISKTMQSKAKRMGV